MGVGRFGEKYVGVLRMREGASHPVRVGEGGSSLAVGRFYVSNFFLFHCLARFAKVNNAS